MSSSQPIKLQIDLLHADVATATASLTSRRATLALERAHLARLTHAKFTLDGSLLATQRDNLDCACAARSLSDEASQMTATAAGVSAEMAHADARLASARSLGASDARMFLAHQARMSLFASGFVAARNEKKAALAAFGTAIEEKEKECVVLHAKIEEVRGATKKARTVLVKVTKESGALEKKLGAVVKSVASAKTRRANARKKLADCQVKQKVLQEKAMVAAETAAAEAASEEDEPACSEMEL